MIGALTAPSSNSFINNSFLSNAFLPSASLPSESRASSAISAVTDPKTFINLPEERKKPNPWSWIVSLLRWRDSKGAVVDISLSLMIYMLRELFLQGLLFRTLNTKFLFKERLSKDCYETNFLRKVFHDPLKRIYGKDTLERDLETRKFKLSNEDLWETVLGLRYHDESREDPSNPSMENTEELDEVETEARYSSYQAFMEETGLKELPQPFSLGGRQPLKSKGRVALLADLSLRYVTEKLLKSKAESYEEGSPKRFLLNGLSRVANRLVVWEGLLEVVLSAFKLPNIVGVNSHLAYVMPWVMFILLGNLYDYRDMQGCIKKSDKKMRHLGVNSLKAFSKFLKYPSQGLPGFLLAFLSRTVRGNFEDELFAKSFFKNKSSPSTLAEHTALSVVKTLGKIVFDAILIVGGSQMIRNIWHMFKDHLRQDQLINDQSIYTGYASSADSQYPVNGLTSLMKS
ncbi:MAG: hypothetical protein SFT81_00850 [Candidatus Caenarcaniphilales bacterium]|nr:hypothetical protein [Candidatus Caenarcaniphilales bacterium]